MEHTDHGQTSPDLRACLGGDPINRLYAPTLARSQVLVSPQVLVTLHGGGCAFLHHSLCLKQVLVATASWTASSIAHSQPALVPPVDFITWAASSPGADHYPGGC